MRRPYGQAGQAHRVRPAAVEAVHAGHRSKLDDLGGRHHSRSGCGLRLGGGRGRGGGRRCSHGLLLLGGDGGMRSRLANGDDELLIDLFGLFERRSGASAPDKIARGITIE